jgi:hypothetical protein
VRRRFSKRLVRSESLPRYHTRKAERVGRRGVRSVLIGKPERKRRDWNLGPAGTVILVCKYGRECGLQTAGVSQQVDLGVAEADIHLFEGRCWKATLIAGREKTFLFKTHSPLRGSLSLLFSCRGLVYFRRLNGRSVRLNDHSPPYDTEVKNECNCTLCLLCGQGHLYPYLWWSLHHRILSLH